MFEDHVLVAVEVEEADGGHLVGHTAGGGHVGRDADHVYQTLDGRVVRRPHVL